MPKPRLIGLIGELNPSGGPNIGGSANLERPADLLRKNLG